MLFIVYLSLTIIIGTLTIYSISKFFKRKALLKSGTATTCVITKVVKNKGKVEVKKGEDIYKIWTEYTVDGQTYTTTMGISAFEGEYVEGQAIEIVYDENDPSKAVPRLYTDNEKVNSMPWLICLIFFSILFFITIFTMPSTLHFTEEGKWIHSIVVHAVFALFSLGYIIVVPHTKMYKTEIETNPKAKKQFFGCPLVILLDCVWELIMDIFIGK